MDTGEDTGLEAGCGLLEAGRLWLTGHTADAVRECYIPVGTVFSFSYSDQEDSGMDPTLSPAQDPAAVVPAPAVEPAPPVAVSPDQHGVMGPVSAPAPQPFGNTVVPDAPAPTADNLGDLAQKVDNPVLVVILAIIALLGVGLWKHLGKVADQKAALDMKRLEIEQMSVKKGQTMTSQPPPCQAANAALEAKITALEARLGKVESTSLALPAGFDAEELDERVRKLELERFRKGDA